MVLILLAQHEKSRNLLNFLKNRRHKESYLSFVQLKTLCGSLYLNMPLTLAVYEKQL